MGNLAREGGVLYKAGECQAKLRPRASSLIPRGSMPGGHDGCDPAGVQEWPGMPTDQEEAVYSGTGGSSPMMLLGQEGTGKQVLPSGPGRNMAEVEEKQPVSEH